MESGSYGSALVRLAGATFGGLTVAEQATLHAAGQGTVAYCGPAGKDISAPVNDPEGPDPWEERRIRAGVIRWLCTDPRASKLVPTFGIQVQAASITGELHLSLAECRFVLAFSHCRFDAPLVVFEASLGGLHLERTVVPSIVAPRLRVWRDVFVGQGSVVAEGVDLSGAHIGGWLSCAGGALAAGKASHALTLNSARIGGAVFLCGAFTARGAVDLAGAEVERTVECSGGGFLSPGSMALSLNGSNIRGSVFLRQGFRAEGEVNLVGATVGGHVECWGGRFVNPGKTALAADSMLVAGGVILGRDFAAEGEVRLLAAKIGSGLDCDGGIFRNPGGKALNADGSRVGGRVALRNGFLAEGEVNFLGADVRLGLECDGAQVRNPKGKSFVADSIRVGGGVLLRNGFSAEGEVDLVGAEIGASLVCDDGVFRNPGGKALYADGSRIGGRILLRRRFLAEGEVNILGADVRLSLECEGANMRNPGGFALQAYAAKFGGSVFLRSGFSADGTVCLECGEIGASLDCSGGSFNCPGGVALDAFNARVAKSVLLNDQKIAAGDVYLSGMRVGDALDMSGMSLKGGTGTRLMIQTARIEGAILLRRMEVDFGTEINLKATAARTLVDDVESWQKAKIELDGFSYDLLTNTWATEQRLEWLRKQIATGTDGKGGGFRSRPYQQLASVLRAHGMGAATRRVLIAMEDDRLAHASLSRSQRIWTWILKLAVGYGHRPFQAVGWFLVLWIAGAALFHSGWTAKVVAPTQAAAYEEFLQNPSSLPGNYDRFSSEVYSLDVELPVIDLGQKDYWAPSPPTGPHGSKEEPLYWAVRLYRWLDILLGWFLATMFVAGLTGLVRRE